MIKHNENSNKNSVPQILDQFWSTSKIKKKCYKIIFKSIWKNFQMQMQILFIWKVEMQMQILFKRI